jgi:F-type H+-transporting ATPase subunit epsilon
MMLMGLRILLPFKVFAETKNVKRIIFETSEGSFGLLPQRLDCAAAIIPGIFTYEADPEGVKYMAVDAGVLVKAGTEVIVSVRNAFGGTDLGKLGEIVKREYAHKNEIELRMHSIMQKLESGFMYSFNKFRNA